MVETDIRSRINSRINRFLLKFSYNLRMIRNPAHPGIYSIEITNYCNLRCIMCPTLKMKHEKHFMGFSLFSKIIDENARYLNFVELHNFGEPLLHPDLTEMIRYCQKNRVGTGIHTSATLLGPEVAEKLIDSGLDYIVFSFDGATKETYEKIRKGANFYEVRENIASFIRMRQEKGVKNPFARIQIIRMKETEAEIETFYNFWKRSGVDSVRIKGFDTFAGSIGTNGVKDEYLFDYDKRFRYPCRWLWENVVILVDGTVVICCRDYDGEISLRNIKEKTLKDIWNSKQMLELRKKHKNMDFNDIPLCSKCREWEGMPIDPGWPIPRSLTFFHEFIGRRIRLLISSVS